MKSFTRPSVAEMIQALLLNISISYFAPKDAKYEYYMVVCI